MSTAETFKAAKQQLKDVAKVLGMTYHEQSPEPYEHGCYLVTATGCRIWCGIDSHKKKLNLSFYMPREIGEPYRSLGDMGIISYLESDPSEASFSIDRPVKALAKDIDRRTVAPAEALYVKWLQRKEKKDADKAKRYETCKELSELWGVEFKHNDSNCCSYAYLYHTGMIDHAEVTVNDGGSCSVSRISFSNTGEALKLLGSQEVKRDV